MITQAKVSNRSIQYEALTVQLTPDLLRHGRNTNHHRAQIYSFCVLRRSQKWLSCNQIALHGPVEAIGEAREKPMAFFVVEVAQCHVMEAFQRRFSLSTLLQVPEKSNLVQPSSLYKKTEPR